MADTNVQRVGVGTSERLTRGLAEREESALWPFSAAQLFPQAGDHTEPQRHGEPQADDSIRQDHWRSSLP